MFKWVIKLGLRERFYEAVDVEQYCCSCTLREISEALWGKKKKCIIFDYHQIRQLTKDTDLIKDITVPEWKVGKQNKVRNRESGFSRIQKLLKKVSLKRDCQLK